MKHLESLNFGTYRQNARDLDHVEIDPSIRDPKIRDTIDYVKNRNRDKGVYGGPGWANHVATYFNDCVRCAARMKVAPRSAH